MYLVPLSQLASVELLIHCLKAAGGQADCTMCPAYRVCMKQCLAVAASVEQMLQQGTLPMLGEESEAAETKAPEDEPDPPGKGGLRVVK
ncbi:hypothetical protein [Pelovirga terrestris]|uniref:Uncharacterized protein n=1 Tax=Pelovirga terrestris TaxID=2771352 RepID=A0A8J6UQ04_9BACT|nr:hypothetical protein [Pelovirga terrestris]MBD1401294.1 hypothetical protein [Pelovirga terrestris]